MTAKTIDELFARLSHRFPMSQSVAKKAAWLFNSLWPNVHQLEQESVQDALQVLEDSMTPGLWRESRLVFKAAIVLIIHEHLQQFDLANIAQLIEQFPEFVRLDVTEKLQLIEFRNLVAPAITVFDHRQQPHDLFIVIELLCGLDAASTSSVQKRQHRAQVFSKVANYRGMFAMVASFVKYFVQELFENEKASATLPVKMTNVTSITNIATSSTTIKTSTTVTTNNNTSANKGSRTSMYRNNQVSTDSDGNSSAASFDNTVVHTTQPLKGTHSHYTTTSLPIPPPITLPPHFVYTTQPLTQPLAQHNTNIATVTPTHIPPTLLATTTTTTALPTRNTNTQMSTQTEPVNAQYIITTNNNTSLNTLPPAVKVLHLAPSLQKALLVDQVKTVGNAAKKRKYTKSNVAGSSGTSVGSVSNSDAANPTNYTNSSNNANNNHTYNTCNTTNYFYNPSTDATFNTTNNNTLHTTTTTANATMYNSTINGSSISNTNHYIPSHAQMQIHGVPDPLGYYKTGTALNNKASYGTAPNANTINSTNTANTANTNHPNTTNHVYSMLPPTTTYSHAYHNTLINNTNTNTNNVTTAYNPYIATNYTIPTSTNHPANSGDTSPGSVGSHSSNSNNSSNGSIHSMGGTNTALTPSYTAPYTTPHTTPHNTHPTHSTHYTPGLSSMQQVLLDHLGISSTGYTYNPHQLTHFNTTSSTNTPGVHALPLQSQYPVHRNNNHNIHTNYTTNLATLANNTAHTTNYPVHFAHQQNLPSVPPTTLYLSNNTPTGQLSKTAPYFYIPNVHTVPPAQTTSTHSTYSPYNTHAMLPPQTNSATLHTAHTIPPKQ